MAAAFDQKDEYRYLNLFCSLCKDKSKKLKLLSCQHSFCTQCLVQHHGEVEEDTPFCCPTCQTNLGITEDDVDSLPDNYLYDIVKDAYGGIESTEMKCTSCSQVEKVTNATHKCLDCGDTLCQNCKEWHCRFTMSKHHIVVPFEEMKQERFKKEFLTRKVLFCELHSTEEKKVPFTSFCKECECLVCTKCTQSEHTGHHFKEPNVAREERQNSANEAFTNLQRSEKDQQKRILNIEHSITDTKQKWTKQETEIYNKATEIFKMVDQIKDEKLAELRSHYVDELQRLNELLEEEKHKQSSLHSTVVFAREFLEHSSDSDFLCHEKDVKTRIESQERKLYVQNYKKNDLDIEKEEVELLLPFLKSVFGEMVKTERTVRHKCRIGKVATLFSKTVDMFNIYGIAFNPITNELLLSGSSGHESLIVVDYNGEFRGYIPCENGDKSDDICVINDNIFLTFHCEQHRKLAMIDASEKVKKVVKLPDDDQDKDLTVSVVVDGDDNVFLASQNTCRIYRLNPGERALRTFVCQERTPNLGSVSHVRLTARDQLVVSTLSPPIIQVYSKEGDLQWQFDNENNNIMVLPAGICCDNDGYIYISDTDNCRIHVIRDKELIGNIPIHEEVNEFEFVPLLLTPEGDLIYGYGDKLVKISFWE